jgi:signal transduction histidine kinase
VQIDFVGLSFAPGESLRYQYQLVGADRDWSAPTDQRAVNYANLAPGRYRFLVRAVNSDGVASPTPATMMFTILRPVWQRWWFILLMTVLVGLVILVLYRYRLAQALKLERVRTRIATDLHDDIGASLSQMALLTEIIKQQHAVTNPEALRMLTQVADTSRRLVDTMSDIVWSVDPRRDTLSHLAQRIERFAASALGAKGIAWDLQTPAEDTFKLTPDQRRHIYLIFKEAITNIARHAECTSAWLAINLRDHQLEAEIRDDGRGLDGARASDDWRPAGGGHGLENMRARAAELRGQLQIESAAGQGTRLILSIPLK